MLDVDMVDVVPSPRFMPMLGKTKERRKVKGTVGLMSSDNTLRRGVETVDSALRCLGFPPFGCRNHFLVAKRS